MKKVISFGALLLFTIASFSQTWITDLDEAKALATKENKKIILVFQGSDWCAPCMKLDKEIWSTEEFKTYAAENYVMLQADFPKRKANKLPEEQQQKNNALAEKYNQQGFFPHVVVLSASGKVLGKLGYEKTTPSAYIKKLDSF
ncbi:thioredoxin family protein [bacterium]|nr:thioredoxin family protein [bacterium]